MATDQMVVPFMSEEIIFNILQKLQAPIDLLRFRCVSKQWCRLISEIITSRRKLLVKSVSKNNRQVCFRSINQTTCQVEDVDIPPCKSDHTWIYDGSCDGLVLVGLMDDLFLWNPFTRYCQKFLSYDGLSESYSRTIGGLCFDSFNNEYKVVVTPPNRTATPLPTIMVGSSRNKTWKHIDFPYQKGPPFRSGPVLHNRIHWATSRKDPDQLELLSTVIIYFDAEIDEFVDLPMPPPLREGEWGGIVGLGILDGCLCMSRSENHYEREIEVLAMKVYGVGESWTTLFKIEGFLFTKTFVPLFYCGENKNEIMMTIAELSEGGSHSVITYDTSANLRRDISTSHYALCEVVYQETLTRPTGYDWEELDSRGEAFYVEKFLSNRERTMRRDNNGHWYVDKEEGCDESEQECKEGDLESGEDEENNESEESPIIATIMVSIPC